MDSDEAEEELRKEGVYWAVRSEITKRSEYRITDEERAALAQRHGLDVALLLRCQRAYEAYELAVGERLRQQARREAMLALKALGRRPGAWRENPTEVFDEIDKARRRLDAAEPETDVIREVKAADDALRAALCLPPWDWPSKPLTPGEEP